MNRSFFTLIFFIVFSSGLTSLSFTGESETASAHFPLLPPKELNWSFGGPFGVYDKAQLQRGFRIYREVCSSCHSMKFVSFRTLKGLGYTDEETKTLAAEYSIPDGPNTKGEMFERPGVPSDYFPSPFLNPEAAAAANGGAEPPDLSLMAKARGASRGFPAILFDVVRQYAEGGPDYIYSLLTGYNIPKPPGRTIPEGTYYNPYFMQAESIAMAPPLSDGQISYEDGSPETVDQYARDIAAFLMWASEPHLEKRKKTGFRVITFMIFLSVLLYFTKRKVWSKLRT